LKLFFHEGSYLGKYSPPTKLTVSLLPAKEEPIELDEDDDKSAGSSAKNRLGVVELRWGQQGPRGLVPDSLHFYIGTHVFRRDNLKLLSAVNVSGHIDRIAFAPDGSRYAIVTSDREARPGPLEGVTVMETVSQRIRVHETATGRTLMAIETSGPVVQCVAISRDNQKVVFVANNTVNHCSISNPAKPEVPTPPTND
jgi:dipeptidyl aminopeptidase/acylaminoacyl peptidase